MNRICISTFYKGTNYGSKLQSIALAKQFESMGYDVSFLVHFGVKPFLLKHPSLLYAKTVNKFYKSKKERFFYPNGHYSNEIRDARNLEFNKKHYKEISFENSCDWEKAQDEKMVFVAGSDIIWQPANGYPAKYFLDFAVTAGLPCFSYASSIGAKELPKKYYHAYRKYLGAFQCIGVREEAAVRLLQPIIKRPIVKVVDPTLLHGLEYWDEFAKKQELSINVEPGRYLLCYFVMDDYRYWSFVSQACKATGLPVVVLPMHYSDEQQPYSIVLDGTSYEFVWLIKNASAVLTDSFHACCFAMQYEREFYLLRRTRDDEDDKYNDFLNRYGLADRVFSPSCFKRKPETDWTQARHRLSEDRELSRNFIMKALM